MFSRVIFASGAIGIGTTWLYVRHWHQSLASQIEHIDVTAKNRKKSQIAGEIECLPVDLVDHPQDFRIIHDTAAKTLLNSTLLENEKVEQLFTQFLRRNMSCFARTPQSWMLKLVLSSEQRSSFSQFHINALDFQEGDVFCGLYRVTRRNPLKVEIRMEPPDGAGDLSGLLVLSLRRCEGGAVLTTETLQWTKAKSSTVLPLERELFKFMHEMASWWLLVTGAEYVESLNTAEES